jgi:hypothetical protein
MIYSQQSLRPLPEYPVYPPYHVGDYLEDYFYKRFSTEKQKVSRDYIGVSWTTLYCDNKRQGLQEFLDTIPRQGKYFTVSQHDDAPQDLLPPDTICFSAGGNVQGSSILPIPLICSKLQVEVPENTERKLLASFVGSITHPIRMKMANACRDNQDIMLYLKGWNPTVNKNEFETFINLASYSVFCLCPRGYGLNSFRLYEAMQLGCIPVVVTDKFYLPWADELNWNDFAVLIDESQLPDTVDILRSYSTDKIESMRQKIKEVYPKYFTLDGMYNNILRRVQ